MSFKINLKKVKITNEEIIEAALTIVRKGGIASINVREIAKNLGCSIQPICRNFKSMENLKIGLYIRAGEIHNDYMEKGLALHQIPFLGMGIAYIDFSRKEKNLLRFIFMSDEIKGKGFLEMIKEEENQEIVDLFAQMTGLKKERAEELYMDIWIMVQRIASMVATNDFDISDDQDEGKVK